MLRELMWLMVFAGVAGYTDLALVEAAAPATAGWLLDFAYERSRELK